MEEKIRKRVLEAVDAIPAGYQSDTVIKETIRCVLFGILREEGLIPVPAFRNPRFPEGPVDIVGVTKTPTIEAAFCSSPTIELKEVKSLERVPCDKKYVITFSRDKKKVDMTSFYLKPGIGHISIHQGEERK